MSRLHAVLRQFDDVGPGLCGTACLNADVTYSEILHE
jgi:hypothetical protein